VTQQALDILLPFWGEPALLRETIDSVLAQTDDNWHLTVVDDAYPDPSVARYFADLADPRITYVRNEQNLGVTGNFRRCLQLASREHVTFLGCDDRLLPNFVEVVARARREVPEATIIEVGVQVIDQDGRPASTLADTVKQRLFMPRGQGRHLLSGEALAASLLRANWLYWPSLVFRRDTLEGKDFRDDLPLIQDLGLIRELITDGAVLLLEPEVAFEYRRHIESASVAGLYDGTRFEGERMFFRESAEVMAAHGWPRAARAARWHLTSRLHALTLLPGALRQRDRTAVRGLLRHALR